MGSNNQNSISSPKIFIPACALLTAVHLVWAQLWGRDVLTIPFSDPTSGNYSICFFTPSTYFGLAWTCAAILLALVALSYAAWRSLKQEETQVNYISLGLFAASLEMAILNISQSLVTSSSALIQTGTCNNTSATINTSTTINATRDYASNILSTFPGWFLVASLTYIGLISMLCIMGMKHRTSGKGNLSKYQWWAYNAFATIIFGGLVLTIRKSSLENVLMTLGAIASVVVALVLVVRRPVWFNKLKSKIMDLWERHISVNKVIFVIISLASLVIYVYIWLRMDI